MTDNGFIVIHRKILETSFYKNPNCVHLAIHCLLKANHEDKKIIFNNTEMTVFRGSFITGRKQLSIETGLTQQKIRTALKILENIGFLTIKTTNKFSIITICKYDTYQDRKPTNNQMYNQRVTNKQPTNNQQITTNNNNNNENNKKEIYKEKKISISFENIWNQYPRKDGRKQAEQHFKVSVKTEQAYIDIQKALANYLKSDNVKKGFIKNGSTWFNNWQDWVNVEVNPVSARPQVDLKKQHNELIELISKPIDVIAEYLTSNEAPKGFKQAFVEKYGDIKGIEKFNAVLKKEEELRKGFKITSIIRK